MKGSIAIGPGAGLASACCAIIAQVVSYAAPYGQERIPAFLFPTKHAPPPYQTVLFIPNGSALQLRKVYGLHNRSVYFPHMKRSSHTSSHLQRDL